MKNESSNRFAMQTGWAQRYQTAGVQGLKPDEYPTVAYPCVTALADRDHLDTGCFRNLSPALVTSPNRKPFALRKR